MTGPPKDRWALEGAHRGQQLFQDHQLESGNSTPAQAPTQQVACWTYRRLFLPIEKSHKRCTACHRTWQLEREALSRKRNAEFGLMSCARTCMRFDLMTRKLHVGSPTYCVRKSHDRVAAFANS